MDVNNEIILTGINCWSVADRRLLLLVNTKKTVQAVKG